MEFETIPTPLDLSTKEKKEATVLTDESFADLNFIHLGSGAKSIIADIQTGMYIGAEQFTSAPFSVDFDGKVIASDITITGGSVSGVTLAGLVAGSDINIQGWSSDLVFSATDYRTVTWTSGTIKLADGTSFSIGTGNTGNMAALTYIYFDKGVSTTALQTTTTASTAVGANKILVAVAQNNADTTSKATLQVFGGGGGQLITVDNIAANSASVNEFISNTAQIKDAIITNAKITNLAVDKLLAGSITSKAITLAITEGAGDVYIAAGKTDFTNTQSGFILGLDDSDSNKAKFYIGDSTHYLNWTGAALNVLGAVITGSTVQTAATGVRTKMSSLNGIQFMDGDSEEAYIWSNGDGTLNIDADAQIYISCDGSGDDIAIVADDYLLLDADTIDINSDGNVIIEFNDDGGTGTCKVVNEGTTHTTFQDDGDLYIQNGDCYFDDYFTYDYAEFFESLPEFSDKKIPTGTSVVLEDGKVRPALSGEIPFGVVSESSFVHPGGAGAKEWKGKYLRDEMGRRLTEKRERWYLDEGKKDKDKIKKGWSDEISAPKNAKKVLKDVYIISPEYDPKKKYIPRKDRPEWNDIGLVGQLPILKGQPTNPNWKKMRDLGDNYEQWLIK